MAQCLTGRMSGHLLAGSHAHLHSQTAGETAPCFCAQTQPKNTSLRLTFRCAMFSCNLWIGVLTNCMQCIPKTSAHCSIIICLQSCLVCLCCAYCCTYCDDFGLCACSSMRRPQQEDTESPQQHKPKVVFSKVLQELRQQQQPAAISTGRPSVSAQARALNIHCHCDSWNCCSREQGCHFEPQT